MKQQYATRKATVRSWLHDHEIFGKAWHIYTLYIYDATIRSVETTMDHSCVLKEQLWLHGHSKPELSL